MRKLLFLPLLLMTLGGSAQIAVKLLQFRPTGELGAVMKKAFTGEGLYMGDIEEVKRLRVGFSFVILNPRLDTFPVYAVQSGGSAGTIVLGGYQTFTRYNMALISAGLDFRAFNRDPFFIYPGMDILFGAIDMRYRTNYPLYKDENFSGSEKIGGLKFRAGVEYKLSDKLGFFIEITRSVYLVEETGIFSHNDIGLGSHYFFNN